MRGKTVKRKKKYYCMIKSTRMRWGWQVTCIRHRTGAYGLWVGRPEGESPIGRNRRRWEDNIKTDIQEVG